MTHSGPIPQRVCVPIAFGLGNWHMPSPHTIPIVVLTRIPRQVSCLVATNAHRSVELRPHGDLRKSLVHTRIRQHVKLIRICAIITPLLGLRPTSYARILGCLTPQLLHSIMRTLITRYLWHSHFGRLLGCPRVYVSLFSLLCPNCRSGHLPPVLIAGHHSTTAHLQKGHKGLVDIVYARAHAREASQSSRNFTCQSALKPSANSGNIHTC